MRLKQSKLKEHREQTLKKQNNICPLCGNSILPEEATLDHDHDTGLVRQVIHRSCNAAEGRIKSWIRRSRFDKDSDPTVFLNNLIDYLKSDYSSNPEHPTHLNKKCKRFSNLNKDVQKDKLRELNVQLEGKETKKELTKLFRKAISTVPQSSTD